MVVLANIFTDAWQWFKQLTDLLADFSAHWWFPLVVFLIAYLDSVIPAVPSETIVIIGGVAAASGNQHIVAIILAGAVGAFLGDLTAYLLGNKLSGPINRLATRRPKFGEQLEWATKQIELRGGQLLITARFIPGGRTAVTLSSGATRQPVRWFAMWVAIAVAVWASYAALLGMIGGAAFKDDHTTAFLVAFGTAIGVNILIEIVRHFRNRSQHDADAPHDADAGATAVTTSVDADS